MPVVIPDKECTYPSSLDPSAATRRHQVEFPMRKLKADDIPSTYIDTPCCLDCTLLSNNSTMQGPNCGHDASIRQSVDPKGLTDTVRAIVNIKFTSDSLIHTQVSVFNSTSSGSFNNIVYGHGNESSLSEDFSSSYFPHSLSAQHGVSYNPKQGQWDNSEQYNDQESAAIRKTLYAADPTIYAEACEPLSRWIADHVWKVTTQGLSLPLAFLGSSPSEVFPQEPFGVLVESINSLLMSTLIQPSAIISSLFYIAHLPAFIGSAPFHSFSSKSANRFNELLLSSDSIAQEGPIVQALYSSFKLFVLGAILSNKILDDHVFTMKTWHDVSGIPLKVLNELEWLSLDILSHELVIDSSAWNDWVHTLHTYHVTMRHVPESDPPNFHSYKVVRHMLEGLLSKEGLQPINQGARVSKPIFLGLQDRVAKKLLDEKVQNEDLEGFEIDHDGPLREEYLPRRRSKETLTPPPTLESTQFADLYQGGHHYAPDDFVGKQSAYNPNGSHCMSVPSLVSAPSNQIISTFPQSTMCSALGPIYFTAVKDSSYQPRIASTLCDYFLSYSHSRVRVY